MELTNVFTQMLDTHAETHDILVELAILTYIQESDNPEVVSFVLDKEDKGIFPEIKHLKFKRIEHNGTTNSTIAFKIVDTIVQYELPEQLKEAKRYAKNIFNDLLSDLIDEMEEYRNVPID